MAMKRSWSDARGVKSQSSVLETRSLFIRQIVFLASSRI